ncbi:putative nonribosomal peptide synthase [Aspergillus indologenus CBS 114.80]|uniref:Putative nonribosomal peptide synthase n=1 Tax=Aspergillus indologenus CBS 114.80 TaxID=1450541 RepID=A0A2V5HNT8_9EURO|nr:putative nonribosomal peptide synthase [Aspergillus indologenus CBS 114.80]
MYDGGSFWACITSRTWSAKAYHRRRHESHEKHRCVGSAGSTGVVSGQAVVLYWECSSFPTSTQSMLLWDRLVRPTNELGDTPVPSTTIPERLLASADKQTMDNGVYNLKQLRGLTSSADVDALVEGYARWVMHATGQTQVAFWVSAQAEGCKSEHILVIAQCMDHSPALKWEAFGVSLPVVNAKLRRVEFGLCLVLEGKMPAESEDDIEFKLCVDTASSEARLIYKPRSVQAKGLLALVQQLELYLRCNDNQQDASQFWQNQLDGFVGVCERQFPTLSGVRMVLEPDYPPTVSRTLTLEASRERLEQFTAQSSLRSIDTISQGAFATILSEYLELDRVILGDVTSFTVDSAICHSTSTLPVPIVIDPQMTAKQFLHRIDEFMSSVVAMKEVPLGLTQKILQCPPSQTPFNAHFIGTPQTGPTEIHFAQSNIDSSPITLRVQFCGESNLSCTLSVRGDLMDADHVNLVLQQIDSLITAMISNPTKPIHDLTETFPKHLLAKYTPVVSEQVKQAPSLSPFDWVDHWAKSSPTWPAVEVIESVSEGVIQSQTWTYGELAQTSDRIATWLVRRGWRNSMIGVCLGRSFLAYAIVLAIWKSGNCYIPIAEDLPEARRVLLLSDSGATALFSDKEVLGDVVPPDGCEVIDVNNPEFYGQFTSIGEPAVVDADPSDNCYLLYTSGSTGLPKGVLVTRGNLSAFTEAQSEYICRDVPDTLKLGGVGSYLAHASRAFDVHICEMVLGWRHGLRLVTAPRTMLLDNLRLVLTQCRISHAGFVPSLLEHTGLSAEQLPDLRYLGVGGEKISETIIERFVGKPSIALVNAYGPTEVTIGLTSHTVTASSTVRNIGSAVGNITLHVLEPETNRYVKRGQAGELCVTGDLVAKGYHGRPDAKGFTDFYGQRMYRTGDIVRLMANNCVEYLGRRDSQAKVRGQRLELEEVSIAVRRCAERPVNLTSIVTPSPITKRPQLVTFISPASDRPENATQQPMFAREEYQKWVPQVLERCRQQLPAYMVPSMLLPVTFIPIQISGKADNRRLIALYEGIPPSDLLHGAESPSAAEREPSPETENAPLTIEEQQIADLVCSVTSADSHAFTKTTSIFQLGLDSLSSLNLAARMRDAGFVCSASDIMRSATVEQLALLPRRGDNAGRSAQSERQIIESTQQLVALDCAVCASPKLIPNSSITIIRPCLPLQESLVSSSVDSETPLYVNHMLFRVRPTASLKALRLAFEDLIQENEIFRTCFHIMDDRVVQVVLKPRVVKVAWDEIEVADEAAAREHFKDCQSQVASKIVRGIERQPPMQMTAAYSTENHDSGWLMLSIHHSIFDGASMGILLDRLYQHYSGQTSMGPGDLSPLYRHFVSSSEKDADQYWSRYLTECRPVVIVIDDPSDTTYSITMEKSPLKLSELSSLASRTSTTAPLLMETIWAIALAKLLGQGDVIFGRVMNGRAIPVDSVESMLVPLVTTVPARFRLPPGASSLVSLIKEHTRSSLDCLPYQHTSLRAIQRYCNAPGPLFNTMFSYLAIRPSSADVLLQEMDSVMEVDYPLALEVRADAAIDTVTLRLRTANDPSLAQRATSMISTMLVLLQSLEAAGDAVVDEPALVIVHKQKQTAAWDESQWTEGETKIRQIVAQITGLPEDKIAKNSSFFALGIDSVISIRLARCFQEHQMKVSSSDILRYPSVGSLYNHLLNAAIIPSVRQIEQAELVSNAEINLFQEDDSIVEIYRCTPLQTAMIAQCLSSQGKDYVHHHIVTLDDFVDLDRLKIAWKQLAKQADILRTSFHRHEAGHDFLAAVHKQPSIWWSHNTEEGSLPRAIHRISEEAGYPETESFQRPPWKVTILQHGPQRLMVVTMHHCLYDGFSLPLLFNSLERIYRGQDAMIEPFAPAARTVACLQEQFTQFWTDAVAGYRYSGIPVLPDSLTESQPQLAEVKVQVPVTELLHRCGSLEVTLQTVALLAYDGGTTGSIMGPLINTVPFRLTLNSILQSTRSTLRAIQHFGADALQHQHVSLAQVQKNWRSTSQSPSPSLFDALFTFNKSESPNPTSLFQPYVSDRELVSPHYKLNVEFEQAPESLFIRVSCRDVFGRVVELEAWLETLAQGLVNIVNCPDAPLMSFPTGLSALPLAAPFQHDVHDGTDNTPETAQQVMIVTEVLAAVTEIPVDQIHSDSSIFTLGVDSILAIDISARCQKAKLRLSASDVLRGKTVRGIARIAAKHQITLSDTGAEAVYDTVITRELREKALAMLSLTEGNVEAILPCLSGQLFYISRWLQSGRRLWEFTFAFRSSVRIDEKRMQDAWHALQERHSILRTSFAAVSSTEVVQVVLRSPRADKAHVERRLCSETSQDSVHHLIQENAASPSTMLLPPARLCLVHSPESDTLLLTLHHALYDAWTTPILLRDLEALYLGTSLQAPVDFSSFVRQAQRKPDSSWERRLAMGQPTILGSNPYDQQDFRDVKSSKFLYPQTLSKVANLCHQKGISMPSLILLAVGRSLARITTVDHPMFGLFQAGRSNDFPDIHRLAGPTANMLPFVVQTVLSAPVSASISDIQKCLNERALHDQTDLRHLLQTMKSSGHDLKFNVLVNVVWGKLKRDAGGVAGNSILTPFRIETSEELMNELSVEGGTSVDALDCNELPCRRNVMLEVGYSEEEDALLWKIDYTLDMMSSRKAEEILGVIGKEVEEVVRAVSSD